MNHQALYIANSVCALIVTGILLGAYAVQFGFGEHPCPLCLLQRMGMLAVIIGLSLNTFFGFNRRHFAIVIMVAVLACCVSVRQVLLHIVPVPGESTGYGTPIFGMHLYTWGVLIFISCVLGSALFLLVARDESGLQPRQPARFEIGVFLLAFAVCLANVVTSWIMCGWGPCCENGPCP